jgi:hypothetical protein
MEDGLADLIVAGDRARVIVKLHTLAAKGKPVLGLLEERLFQSLQCGEPHKKEGKSIVIRKGRAAP